MSDRVSDLMAASLRLRERTSAMRFGPPVTHVYNPLEYARRPWEANLERYAATPKAVLFLGMNPGPWGMAQTGVPFGEVSLVRDWLGIEEDVDSPRISHPKRPVDGFECTRSEVSGRRLWSLMKERFGAAEEFFRDHFVANYCPLVFLEKTGRNRTPDKLPASEREELFRLCDEHLSTMIAAFSPRWIVGVGAFARKRAEAVVAAMEDEDGGDFSCVGILHPSPASPAANRGWAEQATSQLVSAGVW